MPSHHKPSLILPVAVTLAVMPGLCSCQRRNSETTFHFRLPTEYRGVFAIVEDSKSAFVVEENSGVLEIAVPADGVLFVRSLPQIHEWHKTLATFPDGSWIPMTYESSTGGSELRFEELGSTSENSGTVYWFAVGTRKQIEARHGQKGVSDEISRRVTR